MSELCFLPELTVSDWASWVQAIGSIVAVVGAAWIAIWQSNRQQKNSLELIREEHKLLCIEKAKSILSLSRNCFNLLNHYSEKLNSREVIYDVGEGHVYFDLNELKILEGAVMSISLDSLPHNLVSLTIMVSSTLRQFRENVENLIRTHRKVDANGFNIFFTVSAEMVESLQLTCSDIEKEIAKIEKA